jgi:hypothetical protein
MPERFNHVAAAELAQSIVRTPGWYGLMQIQVPFTLAFIKENLLMLGLEYCLLA